MVKTDPKKVPSQIFFLLVHLHRVNNMNTDTLKEIQTVKKDPEKVMNFFLLVHLGIIIQLFMRKKFPLHDPFRKRYKD